MASSLMKPGEATGHIGGPMCWSLEYPVGTLGEVHPSWRCPTAWSCFPALVLRQFDRDVVGDDLVEKLPICQSWDTSSRTVLSRLIASPRSGSE